jgi:hypothetical protein
MVSITDVCAESGTEPTVGTVRNMTTSCSWLSTGCLTNAFVNRVKPFLRFSRKLASAAIGLPLTKKSQYASNGWGRVTHYQPSLGVTMAIAGRDTACVGNLTTRQSHCSGVQPW